jgi:hypothetical protein
VNTDKIHLQAPVCSHPSIANPLIAAACNNQFDEGGMEQAWVKGEAGKHAEQFTKISTTIFLYFLLFCWYNDSPYICNLKK